MKKILKNNRNIVEAIGRQLPLSLAFAIIILTIVFLNDNHLRGIAVLFFLLTWIVTSYFTKSYVKASVYLLLFVVPFNITITFPDLGDVYVRGVYSNFLSPTFSVIDIFASLLLVSLLVDSCKKNISVIVRIVLGIIVLSLITQFSVISLIGLSRLVLYLLSIFLLLNYYSDRKENILNKGLLYLLMVTVSIQVLIALLQISLGRDLGLQFLGESQLTVGTIGSSFLSFAEGTYLRGYGTFPHPNLLAGFLSLIIVFTLSTTIKGRLQYILLFISILGVIITFSRLGWFFVTGVLLIYLLFGRKNNSSINSFSFGVFGERFLNLITNSDNSFKDRILLVKHSIEVIMQKGFLGTGFGNYVSAMRDIPVYTNNGLFLLQPVHNIFLLMVAEMGIWGSLLIGIMIYKLLFFNWSRHTKFLYFSILLFIIVFGMFDHFLVTLPQGLILLVITLLL